MPNAPVETIRARLAELEQLDAAQFDLTESPLSVRGRVVGALYQLHGPRGLRPQAIWTASDGVVRYYDGAGRKKSVNCEV